MNSRSSFSLNSFIVIAALLTTGCGGSRPPSLTAVTGDVLQNGAPVADAQVTFINEQAEGLPATASTDANGKFTLETYWNPAKQSYSGAAPGTYKVTVSKTEEPTQAEIDEAMAKSRPLERKYLIAKKYGAAKTSGLSFEVKASGENHFQIAVD